jgi:ABC-type polysaccharide/polyol phosphate export permease
MCRTDGAVLLHNVPTVVGPGWAVLAPVLNTIVCWLVFHRAEFRFAENI